MKFVPGDRARSVQGAGPDVGSRFERVYRQEYVATARLVRLLTGSPDVADDLAQEAFVRLFRTGDRAERPEALLRTITVNVCRSWHQSQRRAAARLVRYGPVGDSLAPFERELDASLRRLPYDQRAVVVLRYWLGMTEVEVASALDCRLGTVKSRHARALRALRKELS